MPEHPMPAHPTPLKAMPEHPMPAHPMPAHRTPAHPAPAPRSAAEQALIERTLTRRAILLAALRPIGVVAATLVVYALIPIRAETALAIAVSGMVGLVLLAGVFVWRLREIATSARPVIAAVEALCLVFGLFLCLFAFVYASLSVDDPTRFTEPLNKVAAIYFSVTIMATVGFGDISAVGDLTRSMVTVQMVLDLLLIGAAVKLLGISARAGMRAQGPLPVGAGLVADATAVVETLPVIVAPAPPPDAPGPDRPEES